MGEVSREDRIEEYYDWGAMELTDAELELMADMLCTLSDEMCHHPAEFSEAEVSAYGSLWQKVRTEARKRGFWWAR